MPFSSTAPPERTSAPPTRLPRRAERAERARRAWAARWSTGLILLGSTLSALAIDHDAMARAAQAQGSLAVAGAKALEQLLDALSGHDDLDKLGRINEFFNRRIRFATDQEVWGQLDYWASPLEMLQKGRGDCEDYVIGKYFSLIATGVPMSRLRLVYVRATVQGQVLAHMVLAWYAAPNAEPLVLDNLVDDIRPASRRPDLAPVFSFNGEGLWQGTGTQSAGDPIARLSRWRDVLAKARAEGF